MRASHRWLTELSGIDAGVDEVAERLTGAGIEVEAVEPIGAGLGDEIVVAEVRARRPHPDRDRLTVVTVFDGRAETELICGAPNVPAEGGRVVLAGVGAQLPSGLTIGERKIAGVVSRGMLASEEELGIGSDSSGILVLGDADDCDVGAPAARALGLTDTVFELGLTPNRPDCLGHVGLARELSVLFGKPFTPPAVEIVPADPEAVEVPDHGRVSIEIADPDRCPRYGATVVSGVRFGPSPLWLRFRLFCLGVRALGNVVDVTNLVMLEWGHPIHGFDLARLRGRRIVVRRAHDGETMPTLDEVERRFVDDDLLICDGEGPVAVAGVMGGANSELVETTRDVLIECAYFDPRSVRRTSRRLGLHTDASHRFERGVDPGAVPAVASRAAWLMRDLCGGQVLPRAIDAHPSPHQPVTVAYRHARAESLIGIPLPVDRARAILTGLGCELTEEREDGLTVRAPSHRPDLTREVDLIEEVARIHGFEHIPAEVPRVVPSSEGTPPIQRFVREARELSAAAGLREAVTYSFVSSRELEACRVPTEAVELANPLSEERAVMRTSLLPGLAAAAGRARRHQVERIALFEVGTTFHPTGERLPDERRAWAMLLLGPRSTFIGPGEPFDLYDAKGLVQALVHQLAGRDVETVLDDALDTSAPFLHPRRRASVRLAGSSIGQLGELHPDVAEAADLDGRPVYAELRLDDLFALCEREGVPQARPLPRFPFVSRDLALVVPEEQAAGAVARTLHEAGGALVESVDLFDLYRGTPVPEGKKSLAFRVIYRDPSRTLTDDEVDRAHAALAKAAEATFGAAVR